MATAKKTASKADPNAITAYCMKTKEKGVPMQNAVINAMDVKGKTRYIASGDDGNGNKMTTILNEEKAKAAVESGTAAKGKGWTGSTKKK